MLDNISTKDLTIKHRDLADRLIKLTEKMSPFLEEYSSLKNEFIEVCEALEERIKKEEESSGKS